MCYTIAGLQLTKVAKNTWKTNVGKIWSNYSFNPVITTCPGDCGWCGWPACVRVLGLARLTGRRLQHEVLRHHPEGPRWELRIVIHMCNPFDFNGTLYLWIGLNSFFVCVFQITLLTLERISRCLDWAGNSYVNNDPNILQRATRFVISVNKQCVGSWNV